MSSASSTVGYAPAGPRRTPGTRVLPAVALLAALAIGFGWHVREEGYLAPDMGLGYGLGVVGLALMATLPLYSLRKRLRFMQSWGSLRAWFEPHMAIGVIGPVAILFHCNFSLGSLNGSLALASMLVVASSGFVGRFFYGRIHCTLTGRRRNLAELRREAERGGGALAEALAASPPLARLLRDFEVFALSPRRSLVAELGRLLRVGSRRRRTRRAARRVIARQRGVRLPRSSRRRSTRELERAVRAQLSAMSRVATFTAYERLFALWHALHVPLCVTLFTCAAVHVVAVHMY